MAVYSIGQSQPHQNPVSPSPLRFSCRESLEPAVAARASSLAWQVSLTFKSRLHQSPVREVLIHPPASPNARLAVIYRCLQIPIIQLRPQTAPQMAAA
ncbi:hypothetical protein TNIN_481801 [Trichonephila inaurata madagascariensis]|uniref:Uncharacterized protein n=1 Tax=Trichonephila inaurata madagascariensis TaxID=2747483 RepID=A0A8X6X1B6_9ARAC|nr:hypothetical protein TNIN_481801 [Trichonephila inaurata madagascariensis]